MTEKTQPPGFVLIAGDFAPAGPLTAAEKERLEAYHRGAKAGLAQAGVNVDILAFAPPGGVEVLQGNWPFSGGFVLERYPSFEAIDGFWYSATYQGAKAHRKGIMDFEAGVAIPGLGEETGKGLAIADPALDIRDGKKGAYLIVVGEAVDPGGARELPKSGADTGREFAACARPEDLQVLEGAWPWQNAHLHIERFASLDAARDFFGDPRNQAARDAAFDVKLALVAQVMPPPRKPDA